MRAMLRRLSPLWDAYLYHNYRTSVPVSEKKIDRGLIFIIGASGSGTTMLTRILSSPPYVIGLGGNSDTIPKENQKAVRLARIFKQATKNLWDRKAGFEVHGKAKQVLRAVTDELFELDAFQKATRLLHKRSAPFGIGDRYRPDLLDLFELFSDPKVLVAYREPKASTYSSLRRGFSRNLRQSAVICEEQLTYLNAQIQSLGRQACMVLNYETFCAHPMECIEDVASFCQLDQDELRRATLAENVTPLQIDRWRKALPNKDVEYLDSFFSEARRSQWSLLS
jgi:hypothetical protein